MWDSFLYIFSNENPKLRLSVEHSKGKTLKRKEKAKVGTSDDIWKKKKLRRFMRKDGEIRGGQR